jgi:hypothetical protein
MREEEEGWKESRKRVEVSPTFSGEMRDEASAKR